jgi:hypothetical protein
LVGKYFYGSPLPRYVAVTNSLVGFGTVGVNLLIFGVSFYLLLKVLPDDTSIPLDELKHVRVKDFVDQLLPRNKGPFGVGVDNIVLQFVAAKAVLDTGMKGVGRWVFFVHQISESGVRSCIPAIAIACHSKTDIQPP